MSVPGWVDCHTSGSMHESSVWLQGTYIPCHICMYVSTACITIVQLRVHPNYESFLVGKECFSPLVKSFYIHETRVTFD